ncbi:MAG: TonB-dependent receptor [Candidatus Kryptoniota bacterium]
MSLKSFVVSTVLLCLPVISLAQYGKISGKVYDQETREPLVGATVRIVGTPFGASTDINGEYVILRVPADTYTLTCNYIGYQTVTITNIQVLVGLTREVNFGLPSTAVQVKPVEIVAQRPLIEKSATNAVRIVSTGEIENLPVRGVNAYFALQPGVTLQGRNIYIRGSRSEEVGYVIEGAPVTNVLGQFGGGRGVRFSTGEIGGSLITTIPEALQEVSVQAGGFNAEYGGADAGLVEQTFKTGGARFGAALQVETDNFGNYPGKQVLGTYSYGYSDYVLTLNGPVLSDKVKFFLAAENNFIRDWYPTFFTAYTWPYDNGYIKDDGEASGGATAGDSVLLRWNGGNIPGRMNNRYTGNGTLLFDLKPLVLRFSAAFTRAREQRNSLIRNMFDLMRFPVTDGSNLLLGGKASYFLSAETFFDLNVDYLDYRTVTYEPAFGSDVLSYDDSLSVAKAYGLNTYLSRFVGPPQYVFYGFNFWRPGTLLSGYEKFRQNYIGGSIDLTSQVANHELKIGGSYQYWTIRYYGIGTGGLARTFYLLPDSVRSEDYLNRRLGLWGVNNYGYDRFGNPLDSGPDGPRHPYFAAAYIQDRMEFSDLVINAGLRFDLLYLDAWKLDNPSAPDVDTYNAVLKGLGKGVARAYLEPRLGFSFPVTDRTVFHVQYGKFVQSPPLISLYAGRNYYVGSVYLPAIELIPDPLAFDVAPVRTTQYEMGFSQQFTDFAAFDVTGFYKDVKGQLQVTTVPITQGTFAGNKYAVYANGDFATSYGLEFSLRIRRIQRVQAVLNYTLQDARGTNSFANGAWAAVGITQTVPTMVFPLQYDQTHRGSINIDYRFGQNDGGPILEQLGVNLLVTFNSGHPYTLATGGIAQQGPDLGGILNDFDPRNRHPLEPINSSTTPWVWNIDLRIDKSVRIGPTNLNIYVYVQNLLNTQNVINVYDRTGNAYDDGFLSNPDLSQGIVNSPNRGDRYVELYNIMNLTNRQNTWRLNGLGRDLFGTPRQIRVGARLEF